MPSGHQLPHIPATCRRCFDLLTPAEQAVAVIVKKLISDQPLNGERFFQPGRKPLCQQQTEPEVN